MFATLPQDLVAKVFSYDDTYRKAYNAVMEEIEPLYVRLIKRACPWVVGDLSLVDKEQPTWYRGFNTKGALVDFHVLSLEDAACYLANHIDDSDFWLPSYEDIKPFVSGWFTEAVYNHLSDHFDTESQTRFIIPALTVDLEEFARHLLTHSTVDERLEYYNMHRIIHDGSFYFIIIH